MLIKACINGSRLPGAHPALPLTPEEAAHVAAAVVAAGAGAIHMHPRGADGRQSLRAADVGAAVAAVRSAVPGVPVGTTTIANIEPDPAARLAAVRAWEVRPDFVSLNLSESGVPELAEALFAAGIGIEAGIWTVDDARRLAVLGWGNRCVRILIEIVRERVIEDALAAADAIVVELDRAGITAPRLLHGGGATAWPLLREAITRGYDTRIGLEDTLTGPDGSPARDNAELVATARALAAEAGRLS